jgi:2-haloacid dehalogenase
LARYEVFVFDAFGTLFDVTSAVARYREHIGSQADRLSELWRGKQLEYTWVRTLMDGYRNFGQVTADALAYSAEQIGGLSPELQANLIEAYRTLDAFEDVVPTLSALKSLGQRTAILSNGTLPMLDHICAASGLTPLLDAVLSVDRVRAFKTDKRAYDIVLERFGCAPNEVSFHSSNRWDVAAATRYGFRTVWINRAGHPDEYKDYPPALTIRSMTELTN